MKTKIDQLGHPAKPTEPWIYPGELRERNFLSWGKNLFVRQKKKENVSFIHQKNVFRLISQGTFFIDDYIDVYLKFVPEIGQEINVPGIGGVYTVIRKSNHRKESELLKKAEGLEHVSDLLVADFLQEKYPYLRSSLDTTYYTSTLLEVVETWSR